jgi:hypothetical protein
LRLIFIDKNGATGKETACCRARQEPMRGWSRLEVEATVASYFAMLRLELRGEACNKAEHRRRLLPLLAGRTEPAVELKHQNISAILIELGFAYIQGYKPRRNYQQLLADVVAERLDTDRPLVTLMHEQVTAAADIPSIDDITRVLEQAPTRERTRKAGRASDRVPVARRGFDYLALEGRNRSLGDAGEEFVVRYETARLALAGQDRLAAQVERVSRTRGDGLGYDVLSFEESGAEMLIEVKTTRYGKETPFYVSRNEIGVSRDERERYWLYRAFAFGDDPRLYRKRGALDEAFALEPTQFMARAV